MPQARVIADECSCWIFQDKKFLLDHTHRDFIMDAELKKPSMACNDVLEAVEAIFEKEGVS